MAQDAYDRPIDPYVITRAISCFERSLISGNSSYDKYMYQGNLNALTEVEKAGTGAAGGEGRDYRARADGNYGSGV